MSSCNWASILGTIKIKSACSFIFDANDDIGVGFVQNTVINTVRFTLLAFGTEELKVTRELALFHFEESISKFKNTKIALTTVYYYLTVISEYPQI